jgi:mono/diheme cytochrome c family protein
MQAKGCAACHNFPGNPAKPAIGPDLSNVGGLHAADYLAESMREPSKIVVPGKGYFTEQDGRRVSIMPPFEGSEAERGDLLAFLLSLR